MGKGSRHSSGRQSECMNLVKVSSRLLVRVSCGRVSQHGPTIRSWLALLPSFPGLSCERNMGWRSLIALGLLGVCSRKWEVEE